MTDPRIATGHSAPEPQQTALEVDDPASQPYVTGVGGTSLSANPSTGARLGETVWNDGPTTGASGGGVSSMWPMPGYQSAGAVVPARDQRKLLGLAV